MDGKHTSGPWELKRNFTKYEIHSDNDIVAYVSPTMLPEDAENLRLMAAAPDLLEACKTMADELLALRQYIAETYGQTQAAPCLGAESAEYQGRAAIARATQPLPPPNEE